MKIIIKHKERPISSSYKMFAKFDLAKLKQEKQITIEANYISKTRVSTTLIYGEASYKINKKVPGYKLAYKSEYGMFTGETEDLYYFKLLTSQDFEVYKKYLKKLLVIIFKDYFKLEIDELTVNLIDYRK